MLETQLAARYPKWFRGRRAALAAPLLRGLGRWSRVHELQAFLEANAHLSGFALVEAALPFLRLEYQVDAEHRLRIPSRGRLLIVANHPSGARDALALMHLVGSVRRDVRIVANDFLSRIEGLRELLVPVRMLGGRPGAEAVRAVQAALEQEQCVIVFPAGEVSRLGPAGVTDGRWRRGFVRFARAANAPLLPVRIEARNSLLFYGASALYRPAGTALLVREMLRQGQRCIRLRVGEPMRLDHAHDERRSLARVRAAVYALDRRPRVPRPRMRPVAPPVAPARVREAVMAMECIGATADGKRICLGRLEAKSPLLREIGRLRELTFRAVGEGSGRALDLDAWDRHYEHIVLWDEPAGAVAGAYRLARGGSVLARHGLKGLYTASLFDYGESALPRLAQGLELGRSFVAPDYWGSRSIDYLWQGIGAYLGRHPGVRYLFGAVSISASLPPAAREQIVAYYARYHGHAADDATARNAFRPTVPPQFETLDADMAMRVLRQNLDAMGATIPMLYKQYTELCEPGGARFLAFGVDRDFSDCIDGLIELDLQTVRPRKRQRYLRTSLPRGEAAA